MLLLVKILSGIFFIIPDKIVMAIAVVLSPVFYRAMKKGKMGFRIAKILPKVFPGKPPGWYNRIMRLNSVHLMKFAGEMLKAHYKLDYFLDKKCTIVEGREHLEKLINDKNGFMIVTCHLGNWEYAAAWLAMKYKPLYAPVFVEDSEGNRAVNWIRQGHRINILEASYNAGVSARTLLKMIKILEKGNVVYLVADQEALSGNYRGVMFGKEIRVFGGPFILGQKTGKPVLPMYSVRNKKNIIEIHFEPPFYLNGDDVKSDVAKVTSFFEKNIRKYPEQYLWSQDRW